MKEAFELLRILEAEIPAREGCRHGILVKDGALVVHLAPTLLTGSKPFATMTLEEGDMEKTPRELADEVHRAFGELVDRVTRENA